VILDQRLSGAMGGLQMTTEQMFDFDLNGYIVIRGALTRSEVSTALEGVRTLTGGPRDGKFSFVGLDHIFLELMARPTTLELLRVVLGDWFRFDHAFGLHMSKDIPIHENLHGGLLENQRSFWYQCGPDGVMHNGLVKVMYALTNAEQGAGGFICVPGSHKSGIRFRPTHDSRFTVNPELAAGDMLIFTEALVHGSRQWASHSERRVLTYSYAPGFLAWNDYRSIESLVLACTNDVQMRLLRPPFVGDHDAPSGTDPSKGLLNGRRSALLPDRFLRPAR
jgi:hypothetical protein